MVEGPFDGATLRGPDDDTPEIGDAVDAVLGGNGSVEDHGDIEDGDLVGLWVVVAVDEKALVFVAEIIAEDAFHPGSFLFDDQFREIVIVHAAQVDVGVAIPGAGNGLGVSPGGKQAKNTYIKK